MAKRTLWELPRMYSKEDNEKHRAVSWLELFFDLFFVVSIAQLTHELSAHPTWEGLFHFVLLFVPIWWVWIGFTYYNERFESFGLEQRFFTFALMLPIIGLAVFAHNGMDENFQGFVLSYAFARIIITYLWLRGTIHVKEFRKTGIRFVIGFSLGIVFLLLAAYNESSIKYLYFGLALAVEILSPLTTISSQKKLPRFSSSKLPERFGLFVIIVLGEMVVGLVNGLASADHADVHMFGDTILGVAFGLGIWWIYFDFIARRPPKIGMNWAFAWGYLHLPLVMAIAATGAGVANLIGQHGVLSPEVKSLIGASVGTVLIVIALLETTLSEKENEPTHSIWSPGLKVAGGFAAVIICFVDTFNNPHIFMLSILTILMVQMFYGAYAWFTQDISDPEYGDEGADFG